jgi:hypothetical protein
MKVKKVIYKNIPKKENALGIAYNDVELDPKHKVGTIEIEKNQTPLNILDVEVHEFIHMHYPEIPEESVRKMGTRLAKFLWKLKYRKNGND